MLYQIQQLAKELQPFPCVLPDKFVAGCIIAKLPQSWRDFATSLKHKRQEFSITGLIGSLDVEEKARAKDTRMKGLGLEGSSSDNVVQKKNFHPQKKAKGKSEKVNANQTTSFKKKKTNKKGECFVCGGADQWAKDCLQCKDKQKKTTNVVTPNTKGGATRYMPLALLVYHLADWWIDTGANIHVCADISLFSSYQAERASSMLMGNDSYFCTWCWYGQPESHFGKDRAATKRATCSLHQKESS
jgi:hypothetical protein